MAHPKQESALPQRQTVPVNPRAANYARDVAARTGGPQKFVGKRAGGPTPPIPPLDSPPIEGATMAQQAGMMRGPAPGTGGIFQGQPTASPGGLDLRPQDLLPPEAQSDPEYAQGMGSMYATSQPRLALKYGVIRSGQRIPPQKLRLNPQGGQGGPGSRRPIEETIQDLSSLPGVKQGVEKLKEQAIKGESGEMAAEKASAQSSAGSAATLGTMGGQAGQTAEKPLSDQEVREKLSKMDEFDLHQLHEMVVKDIINNTEQKELVESRLEPLDLAELVINYTITQKVPIIPGVFEPEYESLRAEDDLNIKRMIVEEAKTLKVDDRYLMDKFSLMGLACALRSINGKPLPSHRNEKGSFDEGRLNAKFEHILRMPLPMLAALGPHYFWFDMRVRKLFVAEKIKNG